MQREWKKHHLLLAFFVEELQVQPERARMTQALLEAEAGAPFRAQSTIPDLSVQEVEGRCEPVKLEPPPTAKMVVEAAKIAFVGVLQEQDVVEDSAAEGAQVAVEVSPETGTAPMEYLVRRLTDEVANEMVHPEHPMAVVWLS